ncbi:translation initiation factor IF-2-like [Penaeus japonicus]|uniref:translation initiation factor IF-2-like n=1 Tax=Penaeus japonicus TaxID=27405 RepID=UPI001C70E1C4|nr:translation initiation factor IF-2-like [Penaeus japonicus]
MLGAPLAPPEGAVVVAGACACAPPPPPGAPPLPGAGAEVCPPRAGGRARPGRASATTSTTSSRSSVVGVAAAAGGSLGGPQRPADTVAAPHSTARSAAQAQRRPRFPGRLRALSRGACVNGTASPSPPPGPSGPLPPPPAPSGPSQAPAPQTVSRYISTTAKANSCSRLPTPDCTAIHAHIERNSPKEKNSSGQTQTEQRDAARPAAGQEGQRRGAASRRPKCYHGEAKKCDLVDTGRRKAACDKVKNKNGRLQNVNFPTPGLPSSSHHDMP